MAAGDPAYVIPTQACHSLLSVMPTSLLLSVLTFVFCSLLVVLGAFPSPLRFRVVLMKEAYVAYITQYPEYWCFKTY